MTCSGSKLDNIQKVVDTCAKSMRYVFLFSALINILNMFMPIYSLQVLDRVASTGNMSTLFLLTLVTVFALTVMIVIEGSRKFVLSGIGEWLEVQLSKELLLKGFSINASQSTFSNAQVIRDLSTIKAFVTGNSCISLFDAPWSLLFFICVYSINPAVGVVALVGITLLIIFALASEKATTSLMKHVNENSAKNFQSLDMASKYADTVEAMGMGGNITDTWLKRQETITGCNRKISYRSTLIMLMLKYSRIIIQVSVYAAGMAYAIKNGLTIGGVIACSILLSKVLSPFESFVNTWKTIVSARVSYGRLKAIQNATSQVAEYSTQLLPNIKGSIKVQGLTVAYPSTKQIVLKNVSCIINAGECLAILGPSGAGKTTLLKSMLGLMMPLSGVVVIDDIEVGRWGREYLGARVGFVAQDCVLFDGTIKDNIARLKPDVPLNMIVEAAKLAGCHDMILSLPKGYETVIGGHLTLSSGQKQRIAIARAIFDDVKILIMDEPNANLDRDGEISLLKTMSWAKDNGITTIFTTHRAGLLQIADKVMILQQGMVIKYGRRDEVLVAQSAGASQEHQAESASSE